MSSRRLSCVLLCGCESPYGFPHLEAFLNDPRFQVLSVVLPTPGRSAAFRNTLMGNPYKAPPTLLSKLNRSLAQPSLILEKAHASFAAGEESHVDRARKICAARGVPVLICDDANSEDSLQQIQKLEADYAFSAAYPQIFVPAFLHRAARVMTANSHPSLLPKYRGAHPVFWAVRNGEAETGLTFHVLTELLDQGPIIAQIPVPIDPEHTRGTVSRNIGAAVPALVAQVAETLLAQDFSPRPQPPGDYFVYRQDREIHHLIRWGDEEAENIRNLVRACQGEAFCFSGDHRIVVSRCASQASQRNLTNNLKVAPGTIVDVDAGSFSVAALRGIVRITDWSAPEFVPRIGKVLG